MLLSLLLCPPAAAGVSVGLCYCNVGVCYKGDGDGRRTICTTDEDFYGPGSSKESWCEVHSDDRICQKNQGL